MAPIVVYRRLLATVLSNPHVPGYFPKTGKRPGYGRLEINPPPDRPLPPPAPTYYQSWSSQLAPGPVTDYAPYPMPPVIVDPVFGGRNHGHHPGWIPGPGRVAPDRP